MSECAGIDIKQVDTSKPFVIRLFDLNGELALDLTVEGKVLETTRLPADTSSLDPGVATVVDSDGNEEAFKMHLGEGPGTETSGYTGESPSVLLRKALAADPEWAWSWHCNIAMPIQDTMNVPPKAANHMAAVLMQHLFGVDMGQSAIYQDWLEHLECPPSPDGLHSPAVRKGHPCVYCGNLL